jgi:hypothetical protein
MEKLVIGSTYSIIENAPRISQPRKIFPIVKGEEWFALHSSALYSSGESQNFDYSPLA